MFGGGYHFIVCIRIAPQQLSFWLMTEGGSSFTSKLLFQ